MNWISRHRNALGFAGCIAILVAGFVALGIGITRANDAADSASKASESNQRAILVSCTLLANTIIQAGGSQSDESTALFVVAIRRVMTPAELKKFDAAMARRAPNSGLTIPPCKKIANHPEEVKPIKLPATPTPSATPSATRSP